MISSCYPKTQQRRNQKLETHLDICMYIYTQKSPRPAGWDTSPLRPQVAPQTTVRAATGQAGQRQPLQSFLFLPLPPWWGHRRWCKPWSPRGSVNTPAEASGTPFWTDSFRNFVNPSSFTFSSLSPVFLFLLLVVIFRPLQDGRERRSTQKRLRSSEAKFIRISPLCFNSFQRKVRKLLGESRL